MSTNEIIRRRALRSSGAAIDNAHSSIIPSSCIVYVPDDLVADYQAANNWKAFPDRIKGISERPVGGVILNQFNGRLAAAERVAA